jgi:hypothetical protein
VATPIGDVGLHSPANLRGVFECICVQVLAAVEKMDVKAVADSDEVPQIGRINAGYPTVADVPWQSAILPTTRQELGAHSRAARSFRRLRQSRFLGLNFGDWFVLLGGSAVIGLVTLLV